MTAATRAAINAENPWPGLGAFDEEAKQYFNGRGREATELRRLVFNSPLTVLFGASGLGKTSLVQAGLFPLLRKDHVLPIYVRLDVGDRAAPLVEQLARALKEQLQARHVDAPEFDAGESLWEYLHRDGLELWSEQNHLLTPLFAFDQFEEVFTLGRENAGAISQFRVDLADLVENRMPGALTARDAGSDAAARLSLDSQRYRALISFREDFLPAVEGWKRDVPSILRNRLRLLPMSGEQAFEAVHETAPHLADEAIAAEIVRFVAAAQKDEGGATAGVDELQVEPALLSLLCHGLNEKRKAAEKSRFDEALLEGAGQSIVSDFYRNAVRDLPEGVQRFIERELITERGFRNSCDIDDAREVHSVSEQQVRLLVDRRVLRIEPQRGTERVELTHDLLTRVVREDRDAQRGRARQRQQRRRFAVLGLIGGAMIALLVTFYSMYRTAEGQRAELEEQKVKLEDQKAELEEQKRETGAALERETEALKNATSLAEREKIQREFAERETRVALSHRFSNASLNALKALDARAAILFALQAVEVTRKADGTVLSSAEDALRQATPAEPMPLKRPGHSKPVTRAAFSPDGNRVATLAEDGVRIWDVRTSEQVFEAGNCESMVFSPDWKRLACFSRAVLGSVDIWNLETGEPARGVGPSRGRNIEDVVFSADGKLMAAGGRFRAVLWREVGDPVEIRGRPVGFSSDGSRLATIDESKVVFWDVRSEAEAGAADHGQPIEGAAISPDGKWLVTRGADDLRLWDVSDPKSPKLSRTLTENKAGSPECIAFSPNGRGVAATAGEAPFYWDLTGGRGIELPKVAGRIVGCRFTPDSSQLIVSSESERGVVMEQLLTPGAATSVKAELAFSSDLRRRLVWDGSGVRAYEGEKGIGPALHMATGELVAAAFSPDRQRLATADSGGMVQIWDVSTRRHLKALRGHEERVDRIVYSPDGKLIASGDMRGAGKIWDAESGRLITDLKGHRDRIMGIAFSPDGKRVATAGYNDSARVWDSQTGKELNVNAPMQQGSQRAVFAVAFTPDGKRLAVAGTSASLWDAQTFAMIEEIQGDAGLPSALVFSPDGEYLAGSSNAALKLWTRGAGWVTLPGSAGASPGQGSVGVAFNRDGSRLAGWGSDQTVRLWNTRSVKDYASFYGHAHAVRALGFARGEDGLIVVGQDWSMYRHSLKLDELMAEARRRSKAGELDDSDCEKYLREKRCPGTAK